MDNDTKFSIRLTVGILLAGSLIIFVIVKVGSHQETAQKAAYAECVNKTNDAEWCAEMIYNFKLR